MEKRVPREKSLCSKIVSFMLAAVMMVSVIGIMPENVSAADYSMKGSGKQSVDIPDDVCFEATGQEAYIKFKPSATGYVTVKASNISGFYNDTYGGISLCNASKKVLSQMDERYYTEYSDAKYTTMTYGVKAKKTYYLRVKGMGGTRITATFKKVAKKAATKRSKAKAIGKGKAVKGVIIAGDKKADWYKINLKKSQKLKVSLSVKTNGSTSVDGIKVTLCKKNGKNFASNSYIYATRSSSSNGFTALKQYIGSSKTTGIDAGTYYLKVEPMRNTASGYYTVKWK